MPGIRIPNMNSRPNGYIKPYRVLPPLTTKPLNKSWTQDEIQIALTQIKNKDSPENIAKKLNRQVSDIRSKLKAIAADMYIKGDISYDKIHEATGVEKNTLVITSSTVKHENYSDDEVGINVSIYDFPEEPLNETTIHVNVQDNPDEVIVTVSVENPFSAKSICEYISTPIFSTCSRFAKIIS